MPISLTETDIYNPLIKEKIRKILSQCYTSLFHLTPMPTTQTPTHSKLMYIISNSHLTTVNYFTFTSKSKTQKLADHQSWYQCYLYPHMHQPLISSISELFVATHLNLTLLFSSLRVTLFSSVKPDLAFLILVRII